MSYILPDHIHGMLVDLLTKGSVAFTSDQLTRLATAVGELNRYQPPVSLDSILDVQPGTTPEETLPASVVTIPARPALPVWEVIATLNRIQDALKGAAESLQKLMEVRSVAPSEEEIRAMRAAAVQLYKHVCILAGANR